MTERVALITGGAKGIGSAIARDLAARNWAVAICYRSSGDAAAELLAEIDAAGGRATARAVDVSDSNACADWIRGTHSELGRIDALINCAGPYHRVPLLEETLEGWHEMFDHNLHPVFYLARLVAPVMIKQQFGRVLTFSMANADKNVAQPHVTGHYIAKSALLILTRTLAKVLGPHNITVNAISPGFIDSGSAPADELDRMVKAIPAGYIGKLDDAVAAARFLLSDEARYVNGANLQVSGGWGI